MICEVCRARFPLGPHREGTEGTPAHPRCPRHTRYRCDRCGATHPFTAVAFCPETHRLFCRDCAPHWSAVPWPAGPTPSHLVLTCPECAQAHPGLDGAELQGIHPFDLEPGWERTGHGLSGELELAVAAPHRQRTPADEASVCRRWSDLAVTWHRRQGEHGDPLARRVVNPVLYELLGNVVGIRILDAGAGDGYQSRLLARAGARVVAVESSPQMLELARAEEMQHPTGVDYREGSLTRLPVESASQQAVIATGVLDEVADLPTALAELRRVLVTGGVALVSVTHPVLSAPLAMPVTVPITPGADARRALIVGGYGVEGAYTLDPDARPHRPSFHRTVEHYVRAARSAGFAIDTLREPPMLARGADPSFPPALILGLEAGSVPRAAGRDATARSGPSGCGIAFLVVGAIVLVTAILAGIGVIVMH